MLKRYLLLIEKMNNDWYPTFLELQEFLNSHDLDISGRTLQRDIRQIRNEYGIEIEYDRRRRGYRINEQKSLDVNGFLKLMGLVRTADILTESLRDARGALRHLDFDSVHLFTGKEHIRELLQAIRDSRIVGFTYQKFDSDNATHVMLHPYLLREYQYRWYLVGIPEGEREPKIYGLDRIQRLDVLPETFERTEGAFVRQKFAHTVGLTYTAGDPVTVTIRCTELTGKYLQTLPIHSSQQIADSSREWWTVRFYVVPNFEFEQKLLMHLYQLEVMEPKWFREAFIQRVREAARRYSD